MAIFLKNSCKVCISELYNEVKLGTSNVMIQKLDNRCEIVAEQIFAVFQNAYKVEAQLIGATNFPPLARTIEKIKDSET